MEDVDAILDLLESFDTVTLGYLSDMHPSNLLVMKAWASFWEYTLLPMGVKGLHIFPTTCNIHKGARALLQLPDMKVHIGRAFSICTHNSLKHNEVAQIESMFSLIENYQLDRHYA